MSKKRILVLVLIILVQLVCIAAMIANIQQKKVTIKPKYMDLVGDHFRVYRPLPGLEHFFEPASSSSMVLNHPQFVGNASNSFTFNADSMNERFDYAVEKPTSTFRMITLGDSFTFGHYLNTEDNYTERLEDKLNAQCTAYKKYEVLNLGMIAYDMKYSLERYRLRGMKYNPDLVSWLITDEDFITIQNLQDTYFQDFYVDATLKAREAGEISEAQDRVIFDDAIKASMQKLITTTKIEDRIHTNIKAMQDMRDIYGGELLVFSPPNTLNLNKDYPEFNEFFSRPKVHYSGQIGNFKDPTYTVSTEDEHPNKLGSELIANNLFDYLTTNNIIPCK